MKFLNFILYIGMIILININNDVVVYGSKLLDTRLIENGIRPHYYDILLDLQYQNYIANATVDVMLIVSNKTKIIYLHATDITIIQCNIIEYRTGYLNPIVTFKNLTFDIIELHLIFNLNPGTYSLSINYLVYLNDVKEELNIRGGTTKYDKYPQFLIFNAGANSTRRIFPCWDEPAFKANFRISVAHPKQYKIFSSMPVTTITQIENDDKLLTSFEVTPVIPTYLVGIMIIDFELFSTQYDTVTFWFKPHSIVYTKFALNIIGRVGQIIKFYTNLITMKKTTMIKRVLNTNIVVLPGEFQIIQKWGLIVYSENSIMYNEQLNSSEHKMNVAITVARGMTQQLMGNIVSPLFFTYNWLTEGLVSFFQLYALAQINEEFPRDTFIIHHERFARNYGTLFPEKTITHDIHAKNITLSAETLYSRVPYILRMLQYIMTEEVFQNGINSFLNKYQFRLAKLDDLWTTFQEIFVANVSEAYELKDKIVGFLQKEYPVLTVTRNYKTSYVNLYLTTWNRVNVNDSSWTIPITYTSKSNPYFTSRITTFIKPFEDFRFSLKNSSDWIIVNWQLLGFYRVNYDSTNWKRIADYLNHDEYTKIDVLNRAQIIDDASYFMEKRKITFPLFLNIISYLKREVDYAVWYSMEPVLGYIWKLCKNFQHDKLKHFMSQIWDELLINVGYDNKNADTDIMRIKRTFALEWACKFGHTNCSSMATHRLKLYLDHLETEKSNQSTQMHHIFCTGMLMADKNIWHDMINKSMYIGENIIEYLACAENETLIINYLNILVHAPERFSLNNKLRKKACNIIVKKHAAKYNVLQYILDNFEELRFISELSTMDAIVFIIDNVYAEKNLYKIRQYLYDNSQIYRTLLNAADSLIDAKLAKTLEEIAYFTLE